MPYIKPETVREVARDLYGYEISEADAQAMARGAGAMLSLVDHLNALGLAGIEGPFGFPTLHAEALRLAVEKK